MGNGFHLYCYCLNCVSTNDFDWIFIIKGYRTIIFIFIVISTKFQSICPPAFFKCLSYSGTDTELRTTSFIESTGVASSDSVNHNLIQVLSISVELLACNQDWTFNNRYAMCPMDSLERIFWTYKLNVLREVPVM